MTIEVICHEENLVVFEVNQGAYTALLRAVNNANDWRVDIEDEDGRPLTCCYVNRPENGIRWMSAWLARSAFRRNRRAA